ncbi:MAG TPA: DUF6520 family protein [Puia sp.]|nr:DUF6520 family protein [Puia sp.]
MKKIKLLIMTLAILLSIGGAFATRPHYDCTFSTQYFWNGSGYSPAGQFGVNFGCLSSANSCSYVLVNGVYTQCRVGTYASLNADGLPSKK